MPMSANQNKKAKAECIRGTIVGLIASLVGALIVAIVLVFGFQKGLPVMERCHCSWQKVIVFSIAVFAALAMQTVGYILYQKKCVYYASINNARQKSSWNGRKKMRFFFMITVIMALIPTVIIYLAVPFLVDQNQNFLWFFQSGMGILCVIITVIETAIIGVFQKIMFTQEVN